MNHDKVFLRFGEAADILTVSVSSIRRLVQEGKLQVANVGAGNAHHPAGRRITRDSLEALIAERLAVVRDN